MTLRPAPINHGIQFVRTDLPSCPTISAHFNKVVDTSLATVIGTDGFIVSTIEHLMAALAGLSIDNVLVELDAYEVPVMDGSAGPITELIRTAGIQQQKSPRHFFVIKEPIKLSENGKSVAVYPAETTRLDYHIEYSHPLIGKQSYSLELTDRVFEEEVSRARTFGFLQELEYMKRYGLAKGGSLENALVIGEDDILNDEGLRYPDEFVRHKILDSIGDFALIGLPILGHLKIEKSGHAFNHAFLEKFFAERQSWDIRTAVDLDPEPAYQPKSLAN